MVNNNLKIEPIYKACSDTFKIVSFESNGETVKAVVDKFGNILSPFFKERIIAVNYSNTDCLVIGIENHNKKNKIYSLHCSLLDPDKSSCKKVKFPYEVTYASLINEDTLLFLSSEGLCFVDSKTMEQKSDFYDTLYYNSDKNVNSWVYEKKISGQSCYTRLTGLINTDGSIGRFAYDTVFNKKREIFTKKVSRFQYDIIDYKNILEELNELDIYGNIRKRSEIRKLSK